MTTITRNLMVLIIATTLIWGCASVPEKEVVEGNPAVAAVAVVNGKMITLKELSARLRNLTQDSLIDPNTGLGRRAVLDGMINQELLLQEAEKAAISEREDIKEVIKAQAEQLILNQLIFEKFGQRLDVTDAEAEAYYKANKESFVVPERRHVRHILADSEEIAGKARKELSKGADFTETEEEYAIETGRENGGDLGYIERGNIIPEFSEAAFSLKLNEISEPVKTQLGYHIIEVLDVTESQPLEYDSVKDAIKRLLMVRKRDTLVGNWLDELRAGADISVRGREISRSAKYTLETLSEK